MKRRVLALSALQVIALACGGAEPEPVTPVAPPATNQPAASPPPMRPPAPPSVAELSPEEKKKVEDARQLREDRAKWEEEHKAELARWTPELRSEAKALADKAYPNAKAAITAAMAGKHRKPNAHERDKARHPLETLEHFGFKPNMTVIDIGPGDGWFTELIAPALAKSGKYIATSADPNGSPEVRGTFYGQRWKAFVEKAPEVYGKVQTVVVDSKAPSLGTVGNADMVLVLRGLHGMKTANTLDLWLAEVHRVLKPGGILGIEEHRATEGANPDESAKKGYLPEKWTISTIEAAGFKLASKSEVNANPKDTKDHPDGVWTLPPTLRLKDQDRDKYVAIGESDRMTLKFVKVALPANKSGKSEASDKKTDGKKPDEKKVTATKSESKPAAAAPSTPPAPKK